MPVEELQRTLEYKRAMLNEIALYIDDENYRDEILKLSEEVDVLVAEYLKSIYKLI